ncbi:ephrin-B2-like [Glandiceps talaboti]
MVECRNRWTMLWRLWYRLLCTILTFTWAVCSEELNEIVWSETNPIFSRGMRYIAQVKIEDTIDIVCPKFDNESKFIAPHQHIYLVTKDDYRSCDSTSGRRLLSCDEPFLENKFTFLFAQISPIPDDFIFEPCRDYHLISTTNITHSMEGLDDRVGGACQTHNMKLIIRVSCSVPTYSVGDGKKPTTTNKPLPRHTTAFIKTMLPSHSVKPSSMSGTSSICHATMIWVQIFVLFHILSLII